MNNHRNIQVRSKKLFQPEQQPEGLAGGLAEGIGVNGRDDVRVLVDEANTTFQTAQAALHTAQRVLRHLLRNNKNKIEKNQVRFVQQRIKASDKEHWNTTLLYNIITDINLTHAYLVVGFLELALEVGHDCSDRTYYGDQQGPKGHRSQVMHDRGANGLRKVGRHGQQHDKSKQKIKELIIHTANRFRVK